MTTSATAEGAKHRSTAVLGREARGVVTQWPARTPWLVMASSETLPYSLKTLTWDNAHQFNAQNKYGYTGKPRKLRDPMLQCEVCDQWFHLKEVREPRAPESRATGRSDRPRSHACPHTPSTTA